MQTNTSPFSENPKAAQRALCDLKNPELIKQAGYINGTWCDAENGATVKVTNPADASFLGTVPNMGAAETRLAIAAAQEAFPVWAGMLAQQRAAILRRWADLMLTHKEDLALIMTLEQGKPINESRGEIEYAASFFEWFGEEAKRMYGDTIPSHLPNSKLFVSRHPVGVCAAITPWNFPSAMITRKAGAALAAGCPVVVRPASETPFSALALAVLAEQAGVPKGVFSVVTGNSKPIAKVLTESDTVRKLSFTGSTGVGRLLLEQCSSTVKKVSMELGGHAPLLVFADADLDVAVAGAVGAKFSTSGQDCLAANRIFVHEDVYEAFCEQYAAAVKKLKVAHGTDEKADIGPLMNEAATAKSEEHVKDALDKGAKCLTGGHRLPDLGPTFFAPTVLVDVTPDMKIWHEETFGPVAALAAFKDEKEVIQQANDTIYGLAAYVYSRDIGRCMRVSDGLDYGMVGVNTHKFTGAPIPFGGFKQSGLGREGSRYGLDDYTEIKYVCIGDIQENKA